MNLSQLDRKRTRNLISRLPTLRIIPIRRHSNCTLNANTHNPTSPIRMRLLIIKTNMISRINSNFSISTTDNRINNSRRIRFTIARLLRQLLTNTLARITIRYTNHRTTIRRFINRPLNNTFNLTRSSNTTTTVNLRSPASRLQLIRHVNTPRILLSNLSNNRLVTKIANTSIHQLYRMTTNRIRSLSQRNH